MVFHIATAPILNDNVWGNGADYLRVFTSFPFVFPFNSRTTLLMLSLKLPLRGRVFGEKCW